MAWYVDAAVYVWELFKLWLHTMFVTPIQTTNMLWLLVPVWLAWIFAEFFQEKVGTSMGNAISNAVIILWGSIDCSRQTVKLISEKIITGIWDMIARFGLIAALFVYGGIIILLGWRGNRIIKKIGRVRIVTYVFAMFVPIFYNAIPFSLEHIIATILFFPIFYGVIELIDRFTPNPKAVEADIEENTKSGEEEFNFDTLSETKPEAIPRSSYGSKK